MTTTAPATVRESLKVTLRGLIDYAGMYPPASLPLAAAWTNYLAYRRSPDAWMLSHFVVGAGSLEELVPLAAATPFVSTQLSLAIVGRPAATSGQWLEQLDDDLSRVARFARSSDRRIELGALEVKLPDDLLAETDPAVSSEMALDAAASLLATGPQFAALFFELPAGPGWKSALELCAASFAAARNLPGSA